MGTQIIQPELGTCRAQTDFAALVCDGLSGGLPIPSINIITFTGGYFFTMPTGVQTFDCRFDSGQNPSPDTRNDWQGPVTLTYTQVDSITNSDAFFTAYDDPEARITSYTDFNALDVESTSQDYYNVFGRGLFGFGADAGAGTHEWLLTFDFSGLVLGYLPRLTYIAYTDFDVPAETMIITQTGGTPGVEWLSYHDNTDIASPQSELVYNSGLNRYELLTGGSTTNGGTLYRTQIDLTTLSFRIFNNGGASSGIKIFSRFQCP